MKRGRYFLLFLLVILISIIFVSAFNFNSNIFLKHGELKVTQEHPFYLDNKWIVAKDLRVGDELTTINGMRARIIGIKDVRDDVEVYNIHVNGNENYFANDMLVHNKPVENSYVDGNLFQEPQFRGVDQFYPEEVDRLYAEKSALSKLADNNAKGIERNLEGKIKEVYIIDPYDVDLTKLPADIREIVANSEKPLVIKYLRERSAMGLEARALDLVNEIEVMQIIDGDLKKAGLDTIFSEKYYIGVNFPEGDRAAAQGILIEDVIPGNSVKEVKSQFYQILAINPTNDYAIGQKQRAIELAKAVNKEISSVEGNLRPIFEKQEIAWLDTHDQNFALVFKSPSGRELTVDRIISGNYKIEDIQISLKSYEAGLAKQDEGIGYLPELIEHLGIRQNRELIK